VWQELSQSRWPDIAHEHQGMSLEEEIWLLRGLPSQLKRGQGGVPLRNPQIYIFSWGLKFFAPFLKLAHSLLYPVRHLGFEKGCLALWQPLWLSRLQEFKVQFKAKCELCYGHRYLENVLLAWGSPGLHHHQKELSQDTWTKTLTLGQQDQAPKVPYLLRRGDSETLQ